MKWGSFLEHCVGLGLLFYGAWFHFDQSITLENIMLHLRELYKILMIWLIWGRKSVKPELVNIFAVCWQKMLETFQKHAALIKGNLWLSAFFWPRAEEIQVLLHNTQNPPCLSRTKTLRGQPGYTCRLSNKQAKPFAIRPPVRFCHTTLFFFFSPKSFVWGSLTLPDQTSPI